MGKTQKKCRASAAATAAADPLGGAGTTSHKDKEDAEEMDTEKAVAKISAQLQSGCEMTQECGLQSLSLLVESHWSDAIESKLVRVAAPLMMSAPSLSHSATGALRNLSLVSEDVCEQMIKQDIMTPLCALLSTYAAADWTPAAMEVTKEDKKKKEKKEEALGGQIIDSKTEIFVEAINLLWNLCEANATALTIFNREGLVNLLLSHLSCPKFPSRVMLPVMQCLYTVTEDNPDSHPIVRQSLSVLEKMLEEGSDKPDVAYLRVLALGVVINVGEVEFRRETAWTIALKVISKVLDLDQRRMCNEYTSVCPLANGEPREESHMEEDTSAEERLEDLKEDLNNAVQAQQTALEILTNLCCGEDDGDQWEEEGDESDQSDDNMSLETSSNGGGDTSVMLALPTHAAEIIRSENLVKKVLEKANLPAENVCQILKEDTRNQGKNLLKMLFTLRSRSFLCLNNLVSSLTPEDLGGVDCLFQTWTDLGKICFGETNVEDVDLLESATSAMRAVTQSLLESKCQKFRALTVEDVGRMLSVGAGCTEARVRVNVVHISGGMGLLLAAASEDSSPLAELVAVFLCEAAGKDVNLRVVSEALDKLFDMFGEDSTDVLCAKVGLVTKLKQVLPGLKAKIGVKKRELSEEDYSMAMMARTNLVRFIRYKEKRGIIK